jgi:hypothetical protein
MILLLLPLFSERTIFELAVTGIFATLLTLGVTKEVEDYADSSKESQARSIGLKL